MKKFLLFVFSLCVGLVLFNWIIKNVGWENITFAFRAFSIKAALIIVSLTIAAALIRSWRWKTILESQGFKIPIWKVLEYYLSGIAITFFVPMVIFGGEVFRGYDLKEKYSIPWSKSITSVVIDRILEITVYTITAILGAAFFILKTTSLPDRRTGIIILSFIVAAIASVSFFYFKSFKRQSMIKFFLKKLNLYKSNGGETAIDVEKDIFRYFHPKKKNMWEGVLLSISSQLILLSRTILLSNLLGAKIGILSGITILGFSSLATILPIPAAIGSHEAVQSFIFRSLGSGASLGISFVLSVRIAELILALAGAIFFVKFGLQFIENRVIKRIRKLARRGKTYDQNK